MIKKNFTYFLKIIYFPFIQLGYNRLQYKHLKNVLKSAERTNLLNKTIVFNIVRNFRISLDPQIVIGLILALNGAIVKILIDDDLLKHWDTFQIDELDEIKKIKKNSLNPYRVLNLHEKLFSSSFIQILAMRLIRKRALKIYKDKTFRNYLLF